MPKPIRSKPGKSLSNQSVEGYLDADEQRVVIEAAARQIETLFDILYIDHRRDHNTRDTPIRVATMLVKELLKGRYNPPPDITDFDNVEGSGDLIITGPIDVRSTCGHHLMPIYGDAFIGILPSSRGRIIGLSKYDRIVDYFSSRLQIQEELAQQIGRFIAERTSPRGVAVHISAIHMCKTHRGVRASHRSRMANWAFFGDFETDAVMRKAFMQECTSLKAGKGE